MGKNCPRFGRYCKQLQHDSLILNKIKTLKPSWMTVAQARCWKIEDNNQGEYQIRHHDQRILARLRDATLQIDSAFALTTYVFWSTLFAGFSAAHKGINLNNIHLPDKLTLNEGHVMYLTLEASMAFPFWRVYTRASFEEFFYLKPQKSRGLVFVLYTSSYIFIPRYVPN